jgi:hypothetical protein
MPILGGVWGAVKVATKAILGGIWAGVKTATKLITSLLVFLLGTGLIANLLTIEWDRRGRDEDLRAALITDISTSLPHVRTSARFDVTGAYDLEEPERKVRLNRIEQRYNTGRLRWELDLARIRAQIQAYFKVPTLARDWSKFAQVVTEFYQLSRQVPPKREMDRRERSLKIRRKLVRDMRNYLYGAKGDLSWSTLVSRTNENDEFTNEYLRLSDRLLQRQDRIAKDILGLPTVYTHSKLKACTQSLLKVTWRNCSVEH